MKNHLLEISPNGTLRGVVRRLSMLGLAVSQAVFFGLGGIAIGQAEEAGTDEGPQVLTRGPVHEAFAEIVSYNPEPGVIVAKAPPEPIEELPPEERPAGDNISWIPGYWAWDDERTDFIWISGTWRALPPGRQWTPGYWATADQGHQWISGYWADATVEETNYLPKPPVTVEAGPNVEAPSNDHSWTPGSWVWQQERYAWRPGYWVEGRSDWSWIPAHYVWTPRGHVFVDGYWDYNFARRGALYAPVYFQSGYYSRPGYSYSPAIAIGLVALMEHLFLRPTYHHYYFGDYYDRRYRNNGYYSPYAYQTSRHGYDPVYSYRRWTHRSERDWERRYEERYDYRRDNESARPPRTWADQRRLRSDTNEDTQDRLMLAGPLDQVSKREKSQLRLEPVPKNERERLTVVSRDVRKARTERQEAESAGTATGKTDEFKPSKVRRAKSPIVGTELSKLSPEQAPPKRQDAPATTEPQTKPGRDQDADKNRPDSNVPRESDSKKDQPTPRSDRERDADKSRPEPNVPQKPRESDTRKDQPSQKPERDADKPQPNRNDAAPRTEKEQPKRESTDQTKGQQPQRENRAEKPQRDNRPEPQPAAREPAQKSQPESRQPTRTAEENKPSKQSNESTGSSPNKKSGQSAEDDERKKKNPN